MKTKPKMLLKLSISVLAVVGLSMPFSTSAADAPLSDNASPEVYKLLAENDQFRVILATWKPGQRDAQHSHPTGVHYRLTDCKSRVSGSDGKVLREGENKAGSVVLSKPVSSHSVENIGTADCVILLVETK